MNSQGSGNGGWYIPPTPQETRRRRSTSSQKAQAQSGQGGAGASQAAGAQQTTGRTAQSGSSAQTGYAASTAASAQTAGASGASGAFRSNAGSSASTARNTSSYTAPAYSSGAAYSGAGYGASSASYAAGAYGGSTGSAAPTAGGYGASSVPASSTVPASAASAAGAYGYSAASAAPTAGGYGASSAPASSAASASATSAAGAYGYSAASAAPTAGGYGTSSVPASSTVPASATPVAPYSYSAAGSAHTSAWYAQNAPVVPQPQKKQAEKPKSNPSKPNPPKKKKHHPWLILFAVLLVAVGVAALIGNNELETVKQQVAPYENVFAPGVYVDGISLSGKTYEEGESLVTAQLNQKRDSWYVRLYDNSGNSVTITAAMLGIDFEAGDALTQAWNVARGTASNPYDILPDNLWEPFGRKQVIDAAAGQTYEFFSARLSADTTQVDTILETLKSNLYVEAQNALLVSFNPDDTENPFTFQSEVYGQYLDTSEVQQQILSMIHNLQSGEILLTPTTVAPEVTVADLQKTVELRFCAVTPIAYHTSHSTEDRTNNIRTAFSRINGTILQNDEKFSFNDLVGKRSEKNGFLPAIEYVYGQETMGIGGGVCQASTTVYLAAVQSGLKILSRKPHSMAVSYTELGMDATVSDTKGREIDFSFQNTSGGPIYIAAHVVGKSEKNLKCEVRIYGLSLGDTYYKLVTETVETIPKPDTEIKEDKDATYVTYADESKVVKGREGYVVKSYLVTYENNVEVSRTELYTDTYPAKADVEYVGVTLR